MEYHYPPWALYLHHVEKCLGWTYKITFDRVGSIQCPGKCSKPRLHTYRDDQNNQYSSGIRGN